MEENNSIVVNQNDYKIVDENGNNIERKEEKNPSLEKIINIIYVIIAGILTILPVGNMLLNVIESISKISIAEETYVFIFYACKVLGFFIYFYMLNKTTKMKQILTTFSRANSFVSFFSIL